MKLLTLPLLLLTAMPAQAVTWGEFWEPFRSDHHHHVEHHHHYHRPRRAMCEHREYREVRDSRGRVIDYYYETVREPCWRKHYDH